ncbi:MAG: FtsW/RodA/SpoVE family cell cycle protein [Pirellulales bacterium]
MEATVWAKRLPWSIVAVTVVLIAVGWLGIARSEAWAETGGRFLRHQIVWSCLALAAMLAVAAPSYRILCRWSYTIYLVSLGLLVAVYLFPTVNGVHRWIRVGPVGLQPSEFAKVAFVLALARYLMYRENYRRLPGLLIPLGLALAPLVLVLREPDLGTAMVFLPVLFVMLFSAGARIRHLVLLGFAGLAVMPLLWTQMSREQKSRVTALFQQPAAEEKPSTDTYQLYQAKQMMALGGGWGSLLGGDPAIDPARYRLPEAHTDFIFAVVGERLGLAGMAAVLGLFWLLAWRGLVVAEATREPFGRLTAVGLVTLLAVEVLVNTGMTVGLLPVTGLSLPLVSYGGSGLVVHCLAMGLLLNIGLRPGYEMAGEPFRFVE